MVNEVDISYYGTTDNIPCATVFDRRLYLAVMSSVATSGNDTVLVYQKDGTWTKDTLNVGAYTVYRSKLYYGSSLDNGFTYRAEVPDLYSDDGTGYSYFWTSKPIWNHPFGKVLYRSLWVQGENTGNYNLNLGYRLDESNGDYITNSFNMNTAYPFWKKLLLPIKSARALQFRIGDTSATAGSNMKINRLYLNYSNLLGKQ
jgi:hypothetical protein